MADVEMENIQRRTPLTLENSKKSDAIAVLAVLSTIKSFVVCKINLNLILHLTINFEFFS